MRKLSLVLLCFGLTACAPSIIGDWELIDLDKDVFEEQFEDAAGLAIDASDLDMRFNFSIDGEELDGTSEWKYDMEVFYETYEWTGYLEVDCEGDVEAGEYGSNDMQYELEFDLYCLTEFSIPSQGVTSRDEEEIITGLICTLSQATLLCEDASGLELTFTKEHQG